MIRYRTARAALAVVSGALMLVTSIEVGAPTPASAAPASATSTTAESTANASTALSSSSFNPGLIISDALFFDRDAMSTAQIQSFLVSRVGSCANSYCLANYRMSTPDKAADSWCRAYSGSASETAATVIYKVQQACGLSARAILVTLQKEQGLITNPAPSAGTIRIAMGYGCPDTAACDSTYYGFFNQVYQAARQLNRYGQPGTGLTWYPVGQVSAIRYHPNSACGAEAVHIQNRATAALYYYTPYTPNAAALRNLYGTGDSCSSYGNRNFWRFFNEWFGNSLAGAGDAAISALYQARSADLGGPVPPLTSCGNRLSCFQEYEKGAIYWMSTSGAVTLTGKYWDEFQNQNHGSGTLGYPLAEPVTVPGEGTGQQFQTGTIYSSAAGTFSVLKPLRDTYWSRGSNAGALGWPLENQTCHGSVCAQAFQGGVVFTDGTRGEVMPMEYLDAFETAGGIDQLGMPVAAKVEITDSPHGAGAGQTFTRGTIFATSHGTFAVAGEIKAKYSQLRSYLGEAGWPVSDVDCEPSYCSQAFQHGTIFTGSTITPRFVQSSYMEVWQSAGGVEAMGLPAGDFVTIANAVHGDGSGQSFQNGTIYSSAKGDFAVVRPLRDLYSRAGSYLGRYGWPIADQTCTASSCSQRFQNGTITATRPDDTAVYRYWVSSGGARGPLGRPLGDYVTMPENGGGSGQTFANGTILSSPAGTFAVLVPLRTAYGVRGSYAGPLGWPTSEQSCTAGECVQDFSGGSVFYSTSRGGRAVAGDYNAIYDGGKSGLGVPVSDAVNIPAGPNGAGAGQSFTNGTIYEGPSGAFAVLRPIRDAYAVTGSYNGALGWPIAARVCDGDECYQEFQNGIIFSTGSSAWVVDGDFLAAYRAAGGWETLGGARSDRVAVDAGASGSGTGQIFAHGTIYSGPHGAFAVSGTIRTEYLALGSTSSVGWPLSVVICGGAECRQEFEAAVIFESEEVGTRSVSGDYFTEYTRAGGLSVLGDARGGLVMITGNPNGDGSGQVFANGTIYSSEAGTFAVLRPMRDAYLAVGGNGGEYGWPLAPQECSSSGECTQVFQGGSITR